MIKIMFEKRLYLLLFVFVLCNALYAKEDVILKIKKIDDAMNQGTVKYTCDTEMFDGTKDLYQHTLVYKGKMYKNTATHKTDRKRDCIYYSDGKTPFSIGDNEKMYYKTDLLYSKKDSFLTRIAPNANFSFGRGLSLLSNLSYDEKTNEAIGYTDKGLKVVAKVDPKYQFLAYDIRVFATNDTILSAFKNSNPFLADNKYYVYLDSENIVDRIRFNNTKIESITFKKPNVKDYKYDDSLDKDLYVRDSRTDNMVIYSPGEIPKGTSLEKLTEMSKEIAENEARELKK